MKKLLLPIMTFAMIMLPAAANAAQCRDSGTGKFAKCGAPGAVPASQYVAKTKSTKTKAMGSTMAAPMAAKPGFMSSMMKPRAKATPAPMATPMNKTTTMEPMGKTTKTARCKGMTGKFVKCGTPGAKPA